jgi:hypothetical protein
MVMCFVCSVSCVSIWYICFRFLGKPIYVEGIHSEPPYLLSQYNEDSFLRSIQLSVRYIQCTVVTAFSGRSEIALLLLRVAHAVLPS